MIYPRVSGHDRDDKFYRCSLILGVWLSSLWLLSPALLAAQTSRASTSQDVNRLSDMVVSRGQGLLPGLEKGLTAAERSTVAHTIALVDALGELAATAAEPPPANTESTFTTEHTVSLSDVLTINTQHVIENKVLVRAGTTVSWQSHPDSAIPSRIVVENWTLVSPPVRHLDVYTLWRQVQEAGVVIDTWSAPHEGIVTLTLRAPRPQLPRPSAAAQMTAALFTPEESKALQLSEQEWLLPLSHPTSSLGPRIVLQYPSIKRNGRVPVIETDTPAMLRVLFEPNAAPVDMSSLQVRARKGFFKKSLLRFLKPYIRGTMIEARNLQFPSGKYMIEIDISDHDGQSTSQSYYLHVSKK
ncbi:MAG: hypothetical protein OEU26_11290 [Candidatus Tectomicrobia bacterium]|nr:hypothetical protein [Candidatus Tectomicrobia bacterium]